MGKSLDDQTKFQEDVSNYLEALRSHMNVKLMQPTLRHSVEINHESIIAREQVSKIIFAHSNLHYAYNKKWKLFEIDDTTYFEKFFIQIPPGITVYFHNHPGIRARKDHMIKVMNSLIEGKPTKYFVKKERGESVENMSFSLGGD